MLSKILTFLSPDIEVDVSPDRFVFKRADIIKTLKTKIYVSNDPKNPKVLGFGDDAVITQPSICIKLFKEDKVGLLPNNSKSPCLDAFFKHAFFLLVKKTAMVRPKVVFKNSNSLNESLCGYQKTLLYQAAVNGGAREVIFES